MDPSLLVGVGIIALGLVGLGLSARSLRAGLRRRRLAPDLAAADRVLALPPHGTRPVPAPRPIDTARAALRVRPDNAWLADSSSLLDDLGLDRGAADDGEGRPGFPRDRTR